MIQFLAPPDETNAPCIMRGTQPASRIPLHSHGDPETFVTISGSVEGLVYSDEEQKWVRIGSGDIFHVPGHANTEPSPEQIQRFHEISRRYGYWNAWPEENARVGINL